tara:strand:- start:1685 stop:2002 length:318 start_codon:yes stop_codon:yes gene_type:complete
MYQPVQPQQSWSPNFTNPSLMLQAANDIEKSALVCPLSKGIKSLYGYYIVHKHEGLDSPQLGIFINWLTTQTIRLGQKLNRFMMNKQRFYPRQKQLAAHRPCKIA